MLANVIWSFYPHSPLESGYSFPQLQPGKPNKPASLPLLLFWAAQTLPCQCWFALIFFRQAWTRKVLTYWVVCWGIVFTIPRTWQPDFRATPEFVWPSRKVCKEPWGENDADTAGRTGVGRGEGARGCQHVLTREGEAPLQREILVYWLVCLCPL